MQTTKLAVSVRAENGARGVEAWIERAELSIGERIGTAVRFALGGLALGCVLLLVPLIHIVGVFVALTGIGLGVQRLRRRFVIAAAGGTCPRCGRHGPFFSGMGRPKFDLPVAVSCGACGITLTLLR